MKVLIVGYGHVGKWLVRRVRENHNVEWLDVQPKAVTGSFDVMHICFPQKIWPAGASDAFASNAVDYINRCRPKLTIIESTVLPGTTEKVAKATTSPVVHSPMRGTWYNWWQWVKMIGAPQGMRQAARDALAYYATLGLKTRVLHCCRETEWGKLFDTTIYALNIAFVQEINRVCERADVNFLEAYGDFTRTFTLDREYKIQRPFFTPTVIGKDCLIPNIHLLEAALGSMAEHGLYHSSFLDAIVRSNDESKEEIEVARRKRNNNMQR